MSAGLQVWDASGAIKVDISSPLCRLIDEFSAQRDASGSKNYSSVNSRIFAFSLSLEPGDFTRIQHTVTISGSTVSWAPWAVSISSSRAASRIMVFAYA
jgi:hypothetical protein